MNRRSLMVMTASGLAASLSADTDSHAPLQTEFVFEALVDIIAPAVEIGPTPHGIRRYIPITGGVFRGPKIQGVVLPGGADWQTTRSDGITDVDALYSLKTNDNAVIIVRNRGVRTAGGVYFRTVPGFEAPTGPHDWLNQSVFVGSVASAPRPGAVVVRVFRLL